MVKAKRRILDVLIIVSFGLLLSLVVLWLPSRAQYPPPGSTLTVTPAEIAPPVNSSVTLRVQVLDPQGNPVPNVDCLCRIVEEPGVDAALGSKEVTKRTDPRGIVLVTLSTGSTPGRIVVRCQAGEAVGQATLEVQPVAPVLPPTTAEVISASTPPWRLVFLVGLSLLTLAALGLRLRLFGFRP